MTTVKELRQSGYKVRVLHHRNYKTYKVANNPNQFVQKSIHNLGGKTEIIIDSPNGEHYEGVAICSKTDNYNKKLGVKIALGRAMFGKNNELCCQLPKWACHSNFKQLLNSRLTDNNRLIDAAL
jgi:hypothetical protein